MKILVLGSGGREHALVWKLRQSPAVEKIWCAPGNGGIANDAECLPLDLNNVQTAADLAAKLGADLTIVGPELPLVLGIADEFEKRGLTLLGPSQKAAQLEGSKIFAKQFMERHGIPTAAVYGIYGQAVDAYTELCSVDWPLVIKADGLCAGKGVLVTSSPDEATEFIERVMEKKEFGDAGKRVLFEEGLRGEELSFIILTDGKDFVRMAPTRDHKRVFDGDEGPNTGGMGAYSTDDILPVDLETKIVDTIVRPTLAGLQQDGMSYRGFLYFGLMLCPDGPKVLEFNCRLGDPETQAIVMRADFDFAHACMAAARGEVASIKTNWSPAASVCVVMASEGYPANPKTGQEIHGLNASPVQIGEVVVFHSGTRRSDQQYYTSGGRVLAVSAKGSGLETARRFVYDVCSLISFSGGQYRTDIGRPLERKIRVAAETSNG
ncbi:MAG TPA: phosphoribosylamine--glycine ligase [Terriglobales bacterium]|nr:phosphoribosylamine--glycine ligase [Terriglobales bacterium]